MKPELREKSSLTSSFAPPHSRVKPQLLSGGSFSVPRIMNPLWLNVGRAEARHIRAANSTHLQTGRNITVLCVLDTHGRPFKWGSH